MGNNSSAEDYFFDETKWNLKTCKCGITATYRCEYTFLSYAVDVFPPDHPEMKEYWNSSSRGALGGVCNQYAACDRCITDKVRGFFTHHPRGWKEHGKVRIEYERIHL